MSDVAHIPWEDYFRLQQDLSVSQQRIVELEAALRNMASGDIVGPGYPVPGRVRIEVDQKVLVQARNMVGLRL